MQGSVEAFDSARLTVIADAVAEYAKVHPSWVQVDVRPASVLLGISIAVPEDDVLRAVGDRMSVHMQTVATATAMLAPANVGVLAPPMLSVIMDDSDVRSASNGRMRLVVALVASSVAVVSTYLLCLFWILRSKQKRFAAKLYAQTVLRRSQSVARRPVALIVRR